MKQEEMIMLVIAFLIGYNITSFLRGPPIAEGAVFGHFLGACGDATSVEDVTSDENPTCFHLPQTYLELEPVTTCSDYYEDTSLLDNDGDVLCRKITEDDRDNSTDALSNKYCIRDESKKC
jgi:hypothetical protein